MKDKKYITCLTSVHAHAKDYYISPTGSDNDVGSLEEPFASITEAQSAASSGNTVYILGGTYKNFTIAKTDNTYNYVNNITKSGITYKAFSSTDIPVFDFSNVPTNKRVAAFRIAKGVSNATISSIEVTGVKVGNQKQSECFRVEGNATLDQVVVHDNEANGFYANHQPGKSGNRTNNTAYNNRLGNFDMTECTSQTDPTDIPGTREVVRNNIAFTGVATKNFNLPSKNESNNSWNKSDVSVTAEDFQSLDASQLSAKRGADGALPEIEFMHLTNDSKLKGLGCF